MSWTLRNLGDLTAIRTGKLDANASSEDGEYPFFTCADKPLRISSFSYDCECALIAGNGDLNVKYYNGKFDAYQRTYIVEARPDTKNLLHVRYLYHFLETYLETLREQSIGGIIKYIKLGNLTDAQIPLPPLAEQKRIAGILDAADALRAKRREALAQLDELREGTFLELFGDPVSNLKGWEDLELQRACRNITDGTHDTPLRTLEGVPFITSKNVRPFQFDLSNLDHVSKETHAEIIKRCHAVAGDVLYTNIGVSIGNAVRNTLNFAFSLKNVALLQPRSGLLEPAYLESLLNNYRFKEELIRRSSKGGAQKFISLKVLREARAPVGPLNLQRHFGAVVDVIDSQKRSMRMHLNELDTLFASLQSRAFRGEL